MVRKYGLHLLRSVQCSCSVVSNSLQPHGLQHTRFCCPSPTPGAYSNSCPLSQLYHPTISSTVVPFSSHLQSFPASGSFPMSQFFASGGQSTGVSTSTSVLPMNIQDWFSLGWTGFYLLAVQGTLKSLLQQHSSKASILQHSVFFIVQLSHPYMTTGKTIALTRQTFVGKVMSLLFNILSSWWWTGRPGVLLFMGGQRVGQDWATELNWTEVGLNFSSNEQVSFNFMAAVTICSDFGAPKKVCHCFHCFSIYLPWSDGTRCQDLSFLNVEL